MKDKKRTIDECFQQHLRGAKLTPPVDAFANIQSKLPSVDSIGSMATAQTAATITIKTALITGIAIVTTSVIAWVLTQSESDLSKVTSTKESTAPLISDSLGNSPQTGVAIAAQRPEVVSQESITPETIEVFRKPQVISSTSMPAIWEEVDIRQDAVVEADRPAEIVAPNQDITERSNSSNQAQTYLNHVQKNCKGRLVVKSLEDIAGPWELSMAANSGFAQYSLGCGKDILKRETGKQLRWKGKVNVKNSQWLNFWIAAHFEDGCRDTFRIQRLVQPDPERSQWLIPSVFTPNQDGYNDSFYVQIPSPMEYELIILDSRGLQVFKSLNVQEKWDGNYENRPLPSGNYRLLLKTRYLGENVPTTKSHVLLLKRN